MRIPITFFVYDSSKGFHRIPFLWRRLVHLEGSALCSPDGERQRDEEEQRKINDGARERLNVRPASINMKRSRRRRWPRDVGQRFARDRQRYPRANTGQWPTVGIMGDIVVASWYEPCCLGYTSCNIVAISHPLLSFSNPLPFARDTGEEVCLEKREDLSLTGHRFVAELRPERMRSISRMKSRDWINF